MKKLLIGLLALGSITAFSQTKEFSIINKTSKGAESLKITCIDDSCEAFEIEQILNGTVVNENTVYYSDVLKVSSLKVDGGLEYSNSEFWFGDGENNEGMVAPFSRTLIDGTAKRWDSGHELEVVGRYALTPISIIIDAAALVVSSPYLLIAGASSSNGNARGIRFAKRNAKRMAKVLNKDSNLELKERKFKKITELLLNFKLD